MVCVTEWDMSAIGTKRTCKLALMNVRFEGNNGHDADVTRCPLMTQNGRCAGRLNTRPAFRPHRKTCTRERSHVGVLEARTSSPWVGVRLI